MSTNNTNNTTDIAHPANIDLGDTKRFDQKLAPFTAADVERWVSVALLEENPRTHGVAPAFANGCLKGVCVALEQVAGDAFRHDPSLGDAVDRVAKLFRQAISAGARS